MRPADCAARRVSIILRRVRADAPIARCVGEYHEDNETGVLAAQQAHGPEDTEERAPGSVVAVAEDDDSEGWRGGARHRYQRHSASSHWPPAVEARTRTLGSFIVLIIMYIYQ